VPSKSREPNSCPAMINGSDISRSKIQNSSCPLASR
jgi:hypothetical protein